MPRHISRALISVSDKTDVAKIGKYLADRGVEILSTGGTAKALKKEGVAVKDVADVTNFPEMMDGRVKTLHPHIHGGILARRGTDDATLKEHAIPPIDMVIVNLYPFTQTVEKGADFATCVENIDIGGPAMIRAAAKNHADVVVVTNPGRYQSIEKDMELHQGAVSAELRTELAAEAFAHTAKYDAAISNWFDGQLSQTAPAHKTIGGDLKNELRYGENPHQYAALYATESGGIANAHVLQGKELSYNNLNDADAAWQLVNEFDMPACVIVKHANPCGVAVADTLEEAYAKALAADKVSAFGGIVAFNQALDAATAQKLTDMFFEVICAPNVLEEARFALSKKKNLRVLEVPPHEGEQTYKSISGGFLLQQADGGQVEQNDLKVATKTAPTDAQMADMLFAWKVCKHVKSNAITLADGNATVGVGAGQMSRVDAARLATEKAKELLGGCDGAIAASDAFFPFADGLEVLAKAGIKAIIQPGGSKKDAEVIAKADELGIAMVLTGMRHFKH